MDQKEFVRACGRGLLDDIYNINKYFNKGFLGRLFSKKIDINHQNENGYTPVILSASNVTDEKGKILQCLVDNGTDINVITEDAKHLTPLKAVAENLGYSTGTKKKLIKFLVDNGADLNHKYPWENALGFNYSSPLESAIKVKDSELLLFLIESGADINAKVKNDFIPLISIAAFGLQFELVKLLVENNADTNLIDKDGNTPLMYAISGENDDLLKDKSDIEYDRQEIVKLLLDYNADPNAVDNDGICVIDYAKKLNNKKDSNALMINAMILAKI